MTSKSMTQPITSSFEVDKSAEEVCNEFQQLLAPQFDAVISSARSSICKAIADVLRSKMLGWKPADVVLVRYPVFRSTEKFVDLYSSCFRLSVQYPDVSVEFDRDQAFSLGLPSDADSLVEHGNDVVPAFPCLDEAMSNWMNKEGAQLIRQIMAEFL